MQPDLADQRCAPCDRNTPPLTAEQIGPLLQQLDHQWKLEENKKLVKRFKCKDFVQAVDFVNRILPVVEAEGHHPDLYVRWGAVTVYLWTHAIGGLSTNDFYVAAKIERVYDVMAAQLFLGAD
jgi:4a-hydroxytetrahydrobiopterin dehydratase